MTRKVVFRPEADQEVRSARWWYEEQRPGLGVQFAEAIDQSVERIASNPLAFPVVYGETPPRSRPTISVRCVLSSVDPRGHHHGCHARATTSSPLAVTEQRLMTNEQSSLFGRRLPLLRLFAEEQKTTMSLAVTAFGQGLDHFHRRLALAVGETRTHTVARCRWRCLVLWPALVWHCRRGAGSDRPRYGLAQS